jgi:hypothetical protein
MKLAFLLQTVKGVPLGYNFRLYTYGPFDGDVLNDLGQAQTMRAVESAIVNYPSGDGYVFSAGPENARVKALADKELEAHRGAIEWVLAEFGSRNAADLELLSTIVYADRETSDKSQTISEEQLCRQVREIKPRFSDERVRESIRMLREKGLVQAAGSDTSPNRPE